MNPLKAAELLPWLLNRSLGEDERREILAELERSEELRQELAETLAAGTIQSQRIPSEALVDYAMGRPTAGLDRDQIKALLAVSPGAAEELEMVRESFALLQAEDQTDGAPMEATQSILPGGATTASSLSDHRSPTEPPGTERRDDNVVSGPWGRAKTQKLTALAAGVAIAVLGGNLFKSSLDNRDLRDALEVERTARAELQARVDGGAADSAEEQVAMLTAPRLVDRSLAAGEDMVRSGEEISDPLIIRRSEGTIERVLVLDRPVVQPLVAIELTGAGGTTHLIGPQPRDPDYPMDFILSLWAPGLDRGALSVKVFGMDSTDSDRILLREFGFDVQD